MLGALAALALLGSSPGPVIVNWDAELADDIKRGGYDVAVTQALTGATNHVVRNIGLTLPRAIVATVHAPRSYERNFGAAAAQRWWAHYQGGQVHINGGIAIDGEFSGMLVHEMTHAVLDAAGKAGNFDTWLNEGLAEVFEHEAMGVGEVDDVQRLFLKDARRNGEIGLLTSVRAPLDASRYLQSFAAVTLLMQRHGRAKVIGFYRAIATGSSADQAWRGLGTDPVAFAKVFDAWVAEYRG